MTSKPPVVIRRYPASYLSDVAYGIQPMTNEMAEVIRTLRRDHGVDYARLEFYLCESDPDGEVRSAWAKRSPSLQPCICMIMIVLECNYMRPAPRNPAFQHLTYSVLLWCCQRGPSWAASLNLRSLARP